MRRPIRRRGPLPAISVVIPVKDDARDLHRCLTVLTAQLGAGDEIIVVDNGSTDDSADVAAAFGVRLATVRGGGIPAAAAAGYDRATRTVVARLDADCVPDADWLDSIRDEFAYRDDLVAVTGPARFRDGPRWLRVILAHLYLGAYFSLLAPALGHVPLFGSNCAFLRSAWVGASLYVHRKDEFVHDDLDLSFHLRPSGHIRFSPRLGMSMSMRPFFSRSQLAVRFRRGFHTVGIHWPHELPWLRWKARLQRS